MDGMMLRGGLLVTMRSNLLLSGIFIFNDY